MFSTNKCQWIKIIFALRDTHVTKIFGPLHLIVKTILKLEDNFSEKTRICETTTLLQESLDTRIFRLSFLSAS